MEGVTEKSVALHAFGPPAITSGAKRVLDKLNSVLINKAPRPPLVLIRCSLDIFHKEIVKN